MQALVSFGSVLREREVRAVCAELVAQQQPQQNDVHNNQPITRAPHTGSSLAAAACDDGGGGGGGGGVGVGTGCECPLLGR